MTISISLYFLKKSCKVAKLVIFLHFTVKIYLETVRYAFHLRYALVARFQGAYHNGVPTVIFICLLLLPEFPTSQKLPTRRKFFTTLGNTGLDSIMICKHRPNLNIKLGLNRGTIPLTIFRQKKLNLNKLSAKNLYNDVIIEIIPPSIITIDAIYLITYTIRTSIQLLKILTIIC